MRWAVVDLRVEAHRITGLIGPNGAGKTTLFNCIPGVVATRFGDRHLRRTRHHRAGGPTADLAGRADPTISDRTRISAAPASTKICCCTATAQPGERVATAVMRREAGPARASPSLIERAYGSPRA